MEFYIALEFFDVDINLLLFPIIMQSCNLSRVLNYAKYSSSCCLCFSNIRSKLVSLAAS